MAKAKKPATKASKKASAKTTSGAKPTATKASGSSATKPSGSSAKATGSKQRGLGVPGDPPDRRDVRELLRDVEQVVRPNPIGALELLCKAWRIQRSTRLAELAELIEMRVPEAPAAELEAMIAARRVPALRPAVRSVSGTSAGKAGDLLRQRIWSDPRLPWVLLDFLAKPPWRSLPAVTCYQACLDAIVEIGDSRIIEPLAELGERYTAVIPTSVGVKVAKRIEAAVEELREAEPWAPLDDDCDAACDAIIALLGPEVAAQQAKSRRNRADHERHAEFLTAIVNAPDDDAPRSVYADWLSEEGDPRGELINLQLARARGVTDETARARELELLSPQYAERWLGSIAPVVFDNDQVFARGFTAYARLWKNKAALPNVVDDLAWGTVETLAVGRWSSAGPAGAKALLDLLHGPRLRALRALINFPVSVLSKLGDLARIERVEAIDIDEADVPLHLERWLGAATQPRAMSFTTSNWDVVDGGNLDWLVRLPRFDALDRVFLAHAQTSPANIDQLEATSLPRLWVHTTQDVMVELSRERGAPRFDRARLWRQIPPSWLEGPRAKIEVDAFDAIARYVRDRAVTVDVRTPFVPGSVEGRRPVRATPSSDLLDRLREVAPSVTVVDGWLDILPDMIWN